MYKQEGMKGKCRQNPEKFKIYPCRCPKVYQSYNNLKRHVEAHSIVYICECGSQLSSKVNLRRHYKQIHPSTQMPIIPETRTFESSEHLSLHDLQVYQQRTPRRTPLVTLTASEVNRFMDGLMGNVLSTSAPNDGLSVLNVNDSSCSSTSYSSTELLPSSATPPRHLQDTTHPQSVEAQPVNTYMECLINHALHRNLRPSPLTVDFLPKNLFDPKIFLTPKTFDPKIIFLTQNILTHK